MPDSGVYENVMLSGFHKLFNHPLEAKNLSSSFFSRSIFTAADIPSPVEK